MTFVALRKISARFKRFYFQPVTDPQQGWKTVPPHNQTFHALPDGRIGGRSGALAAWDISYIL
jgi:hypothetical protein